MENFKSTKFMFAMVALLAATGMVFAKAMPVNDWVAFVSLVGSTYVVAHQSDKAADRADKVADDLAKKIK